MTTPRIIVIGAGIGGLTTAALLAQAGCDVTALEAQSYPGGCAGTFTHKGYRFDAGATVVGGFQPNAPHDIVAKRLSLNWKVHLHEPAWVVHMPNHVVGLTQDNEGVVKNFPQSAKFWDEQTKLADLGWSLSAQGLPFPPADSAELAQLVNVGVKNLPHDLRMIPYALTSTQKWLKCCGLANDAAFVRFVDAQLLISAQTTAKYANAMYSATALDLARQGVYHVEGGIGGIAEALVEKIRELGGRVIYKQRVRRIVVKDKRAVGVETTHGRRGNTVEFFPSDFVIGNLTPWTLDSLLGEDSPHGLRREAQTRTAGWGAFALYVGLDAAKLPVDLPDHHQIIADTESPLGEGNSVFVSLSPKWDQTRAPEGFRAATLTTHTNIAQWWDLINTDENAYHARKAEYAERMLTAVDIAIPNFRSAVALELTGSPVTYQFYTGRYLGVVGGFPQTSLFKARSPRTGISNVRLVGDSIFPGQSTAGVTLGAIRVSEDVKRTLGRSSKFVLSDQKERARISSEFSREPRQTDRIRLELD